MLLQTKANALSSLSYLVCILLFETKTKAKACQSWVKDRERASTQRISSQQLGQNRSMTTAKILMVLTFNRSVAIVLGEQRF